MNRDHSDKYQAVFFDYGGTLFDYASDKLAHLETARLTLERFGIEADPAVFEEEFTTRLWREYTTGMGTTTVKGQEVSNHCFCQTLVTYGIKDVTADDLEWYEETVIKNHCRFVRLYPDAAQTLESCRRMGYYVGLISDFDQVFLMRLMKAHDVVKYFDSITCSEAAGALKPNRRIFDVAFDAAAGTSPERSFYVGDNPRRDMMGAKKYGMTTIFMDVGMEPGEYADYVDYRVEKVSHVIPLLEPVAPGS